ncbi:uncharacterized protein LOC118204947 isoform X2 [Stegodyphus dumicola]|uniref:uncharacterized protein LOC118204947 isoform X2 n=1 Tax=Stegodyphus dumicola TaxID=202533 RepID=UPI0015AC8E25|nr:uncharacterized protein LOC118204947 isoform X2 [Stegodyphus dumicola]
MGSNNKMLLFPAVVWLLLQICSISVRSFWGTEMPSNPSWGILRYMDASFIEWSKGIIGGTYSIWLSASRNMRVCVYSPVLETCAHIRGLGDDHEVLKQLIRLSPFHSFCYVIIRKFLETACYYLVRWFPAFTFLMFCVSTYSVLWSKNEGSYTSKERTARKQFAVEALFPNMEIVFKFAFLFSLLIILSILIPFLAELTIGGTLSYQLKSICSPSYYNPFEDACSACPTDSGLYIFRLLQFYCLRETLFDFEATGITHKIPETSSEKFHLQVLLSLINWITLIMFSVLYAMPILICYVTMRLFKRSCKSLFKNNRRRGNFKKKKAAKQQTVAHEHQTSTEHCNKKILDPGAKKPWAEMNFSIMKQTGKKPAEDSDMLEEFNKNFKHKEIAEFVSKKPIAHKIDREATKKEAIYSDPKRLLYEKDFHASNKRLHSDFSSAQKEFIGDRRKLLKDERKIPLRGEDDKLEKNGNYAINRVNRKTPLKAEDHRYIEKAGNYGRCQTFKKAYTDPILQGQLKPLHRSVGTNVCFDSEDSSDSSYSYLDQRIAK